MAPAQQLALVLLCLGCCHGTFDSTLDLGDTWKSLLQTQGDLDATLAGIADQQRDVSDSVKSILEGQREQLEETLGGLKDHLEGLGLDPDSFDFAQPDLSVPTFSFVQPDVPSLGDILKDWAVGESAQSDAAQRSTEALNVCQHATWETQYYTENVTYSCWETNYVSCSKCDELDRWWDRKKCRAQGCQLKQLSTCWRLEERCESMWVYTDYCCEGFEDVDGTCAPSIMCGEQNGGCDQLCRTDGDAGHMCECFAGYRLEGRTQCVDMDECAEGMHECSHGGNHCKNTRGSYVCTCPVGYRLTSPHTCEDVKECDYGNGGCEHDCFNTDGAFYCECQPGYRRREGFYCDEIDECTERTHRCSHECIDTEMGYECSCPDESYDLINGTFCQNRVIQVPQVGVETLDSSERLIEEPPADGMPRAANISAIVGAVVGVLALLVLVSIALFIVRRGQQAAAAPAAAEAGLAGVPPVVVAAAGKGKEVYPDSPPSYNEAAMPSWQHQAFENNAYVIEPSSPPSYDNPPSGSAVYDNKAGSASAPPPTEQGYDNPQGEYDNGLQEESPYNEITDRTSNIYLEATPEEEPIYDDVKFGGEIAAAAAESEPIYDDCAVMRGGMRGDSPALPRRA